MAGGDAHWRTAIEAALPSNAATGKKQSVRINSVSCASAGNCGAVGDYDDSSGNNQLLLLTETAGSWATGVEAALPANAATASQNAVLESVSCASAGSCTAVGGYFDSSGASQGLMVT